MENRLEVLNNHERDDEHNSLYTSVSKILDHFYPFPEPNGYMREQIVLGSKLHQDIVYFYNEVKCSNTNADFLQFINFAEYAKNVLKIEPYRTEWKVYDDDFKLSGTIDIVFRKKDDPSIFYMYDWKRTKKQGDEYNSRYVVQLNLYKFLLERNYGIKISSMYLVYFHPCNVKYKVLYVAEKKVTKYLNCAMEWSYELEREKQQYKTTRKRERELMDDSDPLKWMTGGNFTSLSTNFMLFRFMKLQNNANSLLSKIASNVVNRVTTAKRNLRLKGGRKTIRNVQSKTRRNGMSKKDFASKVFSLY